MYNELNLENIILKNDNFEFKNKINDLQIKIKNNIKITDNDLTMDNIIKNLKEKCDILKINNSE